MCVLGIRTAHESNLEVDLSVLPSNAPDLLDAPATTTPAFIAFSLALAITFFVMFTLTAFRPKFGRFGAWLDRPTTQRATAWIGFGGFMIGAPIISNSPSVR